MLDSCSQNCGFVSDNRVPNYSVTFFNQQFAQQFATGVGGFGPCVTYSDDVAADMVWGRGAVFGVAH